MSDLLRLIEALELHIVEFDNGGTELYPMWPMNYEIKAEVKRVASFINISAYAAIQKENEELKRCLAEFNMDALTKRENNERKLRENLKAAVECLELASKRSSYVWTSGGDYFPSDYANEGKIMLAQELLADLKKKMGAGE